MAGAQGAGVGVGGDGDFGLGGNTGDTGDTGDTGGCMWWHGSQGVFVTVSLGGFVA